jgi:hypothetical protein
MAWRARRGSRRRAAARWREDGEAELDTLEIIARKLRDANRPPVTRPASRA